jgi:hypothetical protein
LPPVGKWKALGQEMCSSALQISGNTAKRPTYAQFFHELKKSVRRLSRTIHTIWHFHIQKEADIRQINQDAKSAHHG